MACEEEENDERFITNIHRRRHTGRLALQTAIIHLCCSVASIIIGVFSLAIIKSKTMERVYGLPLWIGLLLLLTGFAGIQCHVKKTKLYAAVYLLLSFFAMFFNLVAIAWLLSTMKKSEAAVISLVCVATFNMGISCLSSALGCHILFTDCKMCMHPGGSRHSPVASITDSPLGNIPASQNQNRRTRRYQETVEISTTPVQARYSRVPPRPGDEPPPYSEAIGPPPAYNSDV